jgi:hypothetical protein
MPKRDRHQVRPGDRLRPDRHRPGLRVRLLGHPGVPRAARRGPSGRPGQLQPGDDHDRPGVRRRDLRRADHPRDRREGHRQGEPGRGAGHPRRADGAELRHGPARAAGVLEQVRRRAHRCQRSRPSTGARTARSSRRSSSPVCGAESARSRHLPHDGRGPRLPPSRARLSAGGATVLHHGWPGLGLRLRRGRPAAIGRCRSGITSPTSEVLLEESILGWKEYELEVMRDHKPTTSWSSARSRTSIRWASTPATPSPWRRR